MAVTTKEAILERIKALIPDSTSDDSLSLFEDISDTLDSATAAPEPSEDWQKKYEENDKMWRQKYRDRFFGTETDEEDPAEPDPKDLTNIGEIPEKKLTYDSLFKEE